MRKKNYYAKEHRKHGVRLIP